MTGLSISSGTGFVSTYSSEVTFRARLSPIGKSWKSVAAQGSCSPSDIPYGLKFELRIDVLSHDDPALVEFVNLDQIGRSAREFSVTDRVDVELHPTDILVF